MSHPFNTLTEERLRLSNGAKWNRYPTDVLPLWVADMDFPVAEPIREAIKEYADGDDYGYPPAAGIPGLLDSVTNHMWDRHGVSFTHEQVVLTAGIIPSLYVSTLALTGPGDEVIVQPPVYPPFRMAVEDTGRTVVDNPMRQVDGRWQFDLEQLAEAITPATRMLILCNPQNPTGRLFSQDELAALGDIVLRHNLWVISDELHADLVLRGRHVPFASVSKELAQRTITLFGPTKTFNIAGLKVGFAFSHNQALLERFQTRAAGMLTPPNVLAQAAARAAFTVGRDWHEDTLNYLRSNFQLLDQLLSEQLPAVRFNPPEGTYLAWLDFREAVPADELDDFLLEEAKVALGAGHTYGLGGEGHARMNMATSKQIIAEAVSRIALAVEQRAD